MTPDNPFDLGKPRPIATVLDSLRARIEAIFAAHVPDLDPAGTAERFSGNGNFQSLSYTIRAVSAAQVTALATDLKACPDVLIVI